MTGNWSITAACTVEWTLIAVLENSAGREALANGPLVNDTVTGTARTLPRRVKL